MKSQFEIPFVGLKIGHHDFEFDIDKSFFEKIPYSLIDNGRLMVNLELEKKETMLIAQFEVSGFIDVTCARCNEEMEEYIEGELVLYYKFGLEDEEDENLIVISPDAYFIDVTQPIYELITVSMPSRSVHDEEDCNPEMVNLIERFGSNQGDNKPDSDDDDIDPRWAALKNLY